MKIYRTKERRGAHVGSLLLKGYSKAFIGFSGSSYNATKTRKKQKYYCWLFEPLGSVETRKLEKKQALENQ